jgi:hypothetical protein
MGGRDSYPPASSLLSIQYSQGLRKYPQMYPLRAMARDIHHILAHSLLVLINECIGDLALIENRQTVNRPQSRIREAGYTDKWITNGMVRCIHPARSWDIRSVRGGIPWNYTRSALILARRSSIWLGSTCVARLWCARSCSRKQLLQFTANLKVELIDMEACGGSHLLGRALREQGHEVRLIPAQYVKPLSRCTKFPEFWIASVLKSRTE